VHLEKPIAHRPTHPILLDGRQGNWQEW
jgi:hypothetical protein